MVVEMLISRMDVGEGHGWSSSKVARHKDSKYIPITNR